ncbi:O-antigen ligase family protein [Lentilactobacillus buchneri]|uniref:O-antigen ligase family protein n=1 Tax=Lentilactobacillus buchneri TaxID=1581 RepID=UPI0021A3C13A|nr:O-antigen ligase family protein [Lentilactobacillus buchneri]MCT3551749.1 hypothetical protein [Lentilactobacillus buchneri]
MIKKTVNRISPFLLFLLSILSVLNGIESFAIGCAFVSILFILNIKKIKFIKTVTVLPYYPFVILGLISTLVFGNSATITNLAKGTLGVLSFMVFLLLGSMLSIIYNNKSFVKSVMCFGFIYSLYQLILMGINLPTMTSIRSIRLDINKSPLFLVFILILVLYDKYLFRLNTRGKKNALIVVISIAVIVTFSRTSYLYFIILILILGLLSLKPDVFLLSVKIGFCYIMMMVIFILLMPQEIKIEFVYKITDVIPETSSQNDWNINTNIIQNWRGFEKYSAIDQFNSYSLIQKIFGEGLGQGIFVGNYASLVGVENSQYLPFLHNSLYTILIKMGYIGVSYYVTYFFVNIVALLKKIKLNLLYILPICLLVGIFISSIVTQGGIVVGNDSILLTFLGYFLNKSKYEVVS